MIEITGTVQYQDIGTGFWGIIGSDGSKWQPERLPGALQTEGLSVNIKAKEKKGSASIFMWGTTIQIIDYSVNS